MVNRKLVLLNILICLFLDNVFLSFIGRANVIQKISIKVFLMPKDRYAKYIINDIDIEITDTDYNNIGTIERINNMGEFENKKPINLNKNENYILRLQSKSNNYINREIVLNFNNEPKRYILYMLRDKSYKYNDNYKQNGMIHFQCNGKYCYDRALAYYEPFREDSEDEYSSHKIRTEFTFNLARAEYNTFKYLDFDLCKESKENFLKTKKLLEQDAYYRRTRTRYKISEEHLTDPLEYLEQHC